MRSFKNSLNFSSFVVIRFENLNPYNILIKNIKLPSVKTLIITVYNAKISQHFLRVRNSFSRHNEIF